LRLDGKPLDNPFAGAFPADGREHELVASAEGYQNEVRRLRFERDLEIRLSLSPILRGRAAANNPAPEAKPATASAPTSVAPAPPARSVPASTAAQPGADLRKSPPRPSRTIDEKDPY
jgi:hypothetical protein